MSAERLRRHWSALLVFSVLSVVHTWPLATAPATLSLNANGDAQLNEWILAWIAHRLPSDPLHLFDANIFHPEKRSLAFSEPLIVPALVSAPVSWLGGSPVLAYNLVLLAGFVLTGFSAYAVVCSWTADRAAGVLAGSLFAFNTHTLTRLPHLQAIHAYGLPLALLFTDRIIRKPGAGAAAGLAAAMCLMAYTSGYLVVFAIVMIAVALLSRAAEWAGRTGAVLGALALAVFATAVAVVPVVAPYRKAAVEQGMIRSVDNVRQFSATSAGYAATAARVHAPWSRRLLRNPVNAFFPGVAALLLAAYAGWRAVRGRAHAMRVLMLLCIGAAGVVLSLGVQTPVYGVLFELFPPVQGLRAAARFGNLFLLSIALLAGIGLAALGQRYRTRAWMPAATATIVAVAAAEALVAPVEYRPFHGIPRVYSLLADEPAPVVLAEFPFYPAHAAFENAEYVLNSTAHWRPLLNGYSGYTPASYRRLAWILWYFPREHVFPVMRQAGVTHFMVHPARLGDKAQETLEILSRRPDVEMVATSPGSGPRLYRFK